MRKILISKIQPDMKLGKTVYTPNGHVLLAGGAELNPGYLKRLQTLGFSAIFVQDGYCHDLNFPEIISERTRIDGAVQIKNIFEETCKYKKVDTATVKNVVNQLVDEIVQSRKNLFETTDIRCYEAYLFAHSINVCAIALRIGLQLGYNELQLRDLGVGALLHDIGMMFVEKQVLEKIGKLTPAEFLKVKQHSNDGFNLLREHQDINLLSAHVAFQHHERIDGAGYPRLLKKTEICEFARIVAIADMFDALTSENKHRKSYSVPAALEIMKTEIGRQIDEDLAAMFVENVALYSTGQLVELNTGETAMVTANSPGHSSSPRVKVLLDNRRRLVDNFKEIDLFNEPSIVITKAIEEDAFCANVSKLLGEAADRAIV